MADEKKVKRLYVVRSDDSCRLVNAVSGAAALRHVVKPVYRVLPAKASDVATILTAGGKVEQADDEGEPSIPEQVTLNPSGGKLK
jgi:hypothetical protein